MTRSASAIVPDRALAWVSRAVSAGPMPSAVLGIATSHGIELIEAFGATDGRPARIDDHYSLYSVTKPLTGLAALRAVERGELSLHAPLSGALPGFGRDRVDVVRLEHLLSHTAGISEPPLDDPRDPREALLAAPQAFTAGTMTSYSTLAFAGVGVLLEQAMGRTVQEQIEDLDGGIGGITFDPTVDPLPVLGGERVGVDPDPIRLGRHPGAGAFGTAAALLDLASRILRTAHDDGVDPVHPVTLAAMTRPRTLGLPEAVPMPERREHGLAWHLRDASTALLDPRAFGHAGASGTQWWIHPERDVAYVLLTNVFDAPALGVDFDALDNAVVGGTHSGARA
jgi:CubicO group peptidase (beta-lactamase class C family)